MQTYIEFINEIAGLPEGTDIYVSDIEFIENFDVYTKAQVEGYITTKLNGAPNSAWGLKVTVLKKAEKLVSNNVIDAYFG